MLNANIIKQIIKEELTRFLSEANGDMVEVIFPIDSQEAPARYKTSGEEVSAGAPPKASKMTQEQYKAWMGDITKKLEGLGCINIKYNSASNRIECEASVETLSKLLQNCGALRKEFGLWDSEIEGGLVKNGYQPIWSATQQIPPEKLNLVLAPDVLPTPKTAQESYLQEKKMSKSQMGKREKFVKGMKSAAKDFEKRYPGKGKAVMYATATKMAQKKKKK